MLYAVGYPHIPRATHYFGKERTITVKIHFAYYNLAIDNPLMYAALALDCELQAWADAMDEDWNI